MLKRDRGRLMIRNDVGSKSFSISDDMLSIRYVFTEGSPQVPTDGCLALRLSVLPGSADDGVLDRMIKPSTTLLHALHRFEA